MTQVRFDKCAPFLHSGRTLRKTLDDGAKEDYDEDRESAEREKFRRIGIPQGGK